MSAIGGMVPENQHLLEVVAPSSGRDSIAVAPNKILSPPAVPGAPEPPSSAIKGSVKMLDNS